MFLSITGVTPDNKLAKYQAFDLKADADTHALEYSGFVVSDPGGNQQFWVVNATAKTVTRDDAGADAATAIQAWERLRRDRDQLLNNTDWWVLRGSISESQTTYRQQLRDLPANTPDPANPTWPVAPGV